MGVNKEQIKTIINGILFIDDPDTIQDETRIFLDLSFNSIDFIDLVFELGSLCGQEIKPETLWPFPKMMLDDQQYLKGNWTAFGLATIQDYLGKPLPPDTALKDLYPYFTLNYIEHVLNRVQECV